MYKLVHLTGIGGIGMSGIAEILINLGVGIQGSDLVRNENTVRLEKLGATIYYGHTGTQINNADVLVFSSSISSNNPELIEAMKRNVPIIPRAQMLAEIMKLKQGIIVAGSHGKTTTSGLIFSILNKANLEPSAVIGGILKDIGSNSKYGNGQFLVAEADESDGSFLMLSPKIAVVTNLDLEHIDYWKGGLPDLQRAFVKFLNTLPISGLAIICTDSIPLADIKIKLKCRIVTYGINDKSDYSAKNIIFNPFFTTFDLIKYGRNLGRVQLKLTGEHNVKNSLASIVVAEELGIELNIVNSSLKTFSGILRRFNYVGEKNNVLVIDDYGHHPEEILAVLKTARNIFQKRRLVVLFEPHRYTRTHCLMNAFTEAFDSVDKLIVSDIYPSGEKPIIGVSSQNLVNKIKTLGRIDTEYGGNLKQSTEKIIKIARSGDVIITLGAGPVTNSSAEILESLK